MYSVHVVQAFPARVSPFGNLRIKGYLLLPEAYRSLSRPSSAPIAKAFPLRSLQLDLFTITVCFQLELLSKFSLAIFVVHTFVCFQQ